MTKSAKPKTRSRLDRLKAAAAEIDALKRGEKTGARIRSPAGMIR